MSLTKRLINQDREVVFQLPKKEKELRKKYSGAGTGIRCRLVTVTLDNGTKEVLCSSLLGKEAFSTDCFAGLYLYK